jgi:hypothetical protein
MEPEQNGTPPRPEQLADGLRRLAEVEQAEFERVSTQLAEIRERRDRYQRSLEALTQEVRPARPPQIRAGNKRRWREMKDWHISDERVAMVETRFRELVAETEDGRLAGGTLAKATPGISPETARRALNVLREREVVRLAGTGRGGAIYFALMPERQKIEQQEAPDDAATT